MYKQLVRGLSLALLVITLAACTQLSGKPTAPKMVGTTLTGVGHLGRMTGIPRYSVDGHWGGNVPGWGGGGGSVCCTELPAEKPDTPYMVKVQWETCDISHIKFIDGKAVDPDAECVSSEHEATVPVHYASDQLDYVQVHFLPGNKVEVWSSNIAAWASKYPGPAYSRGPAPDYAPVVDTPSAAKPKGGE